METKEKLNLSEDDSSLNVYKKKRIEDWLEQSLQFYPIISIGELTEEEERLKTSDFSSNESSDSIISTFETIDGYEQLNPNDFRVVTLTEVHRFRQVLVRNVLGMSLDEFMATYRQLFDEELTSGQFPSIIEMIANLNKVFTIERVEDPDDDRLPEDDVFRILLFDAKREEIPKIFTNKITEECVLNIPESEQLFWFNAVIRDESIRDLDINRMDTNYKEFGFKSNSQFIHRLAQLIPIQVIDKKFIRLKPLSEIQDFLTQLSDKKKIQFSVPEDCIGLGFEIPVLTVEEVLNSLKNQIKPVYISAFHSFKKFFGIVIKSYFFELWKQIELFYESSECLHYTVPKTMVISGLYCATKCPQNGWIRTEVTEMADFENSDTIGLKSIDFGYKLKAKLSQLRLLRREFGELPVQLVRMSLNGVKNVKKLKKHFFKHRTKRKETPKDELFCQFVSAKEQTIDVIVFETDDLYDYYSIGQLLIESDLAERTEEYMEPDWDLLFNSVKDYYEL